MPPPRGTATHAVPTADCITRPRPPHPQPPKACSCLSHGPSPRAPLACRRCAALPPDLPESEPSTQDALATLHLNPMDVSELRVGATKPTRRAEPVPPQVLAKFKFRLVQHTKLTYPRRRSNPVQHADVRRMCVRDPRPVIAPSMIRMAPPVIEPSICGLVRLLDTIISLPFLIWQVRLVDTEHERALGALSLAARARRLAPHQAVEGETAVGPRLCERRGCSDQGTRSARPRGALGSTKGLTWHDLT
jgi:hypothetical protein